MAVTQRKRMSLSDVIQGSRRLPSRIVVHGQAGIGKTSFAAQAPKPFFLMSPGETGLHTLMDAGLIGEIPNIEVQEWEAVQAIIAELTATDHGHKTLVIDTLDGLEKLANDFVCRTKYGGDWGEKGFMSFHAGYRVVAEGPWKELLASLDRLREKRSMSILPLAHTEVGTFRNPDGPDYDRYSPSMYKWAWKLTENWADAVLFAHRDVAIVTDKNKAKGKARGDAGRILLCELAGTHDAKNRLNLPAEIDMGTSAAEAWQNFIQAVKNGRKQKEAA